MTFAPQLSAEDREKREIRFDLEVKEREAERLGRHALVELRCQLLEEPPRTDGSATAVP
jgi:hypothetical protein